MTVGSLATRSLLDSVALEASFECPNEPNFSSHHRDQSNPNWRHTFLRDEAKFRKMVLPNEPNVGRFKKIEEHIGSKRNGARVKTWKSGNALGFAGLALGPRRGGLNPNISVEMGSNWRRIFQWNGRPCPCFLISLLCVRRAGLVGLSNWNGFLDRAG